MFDIVALGELLIDFTPTTSTESSQPAFLQTPGGAPANVLAAAARLGSKTALIAGVGDDPLGQFLIDSVAERGIDTTHIRKDPQAPTTLAFVHLDGGGDRSFSFYRNPGADLMLSDGDIPDALLQHCRIFHFGSLSLTDEPARSATRHAVNLAKRSGCLVSFDPNYRPALWPSAEAAAEQMRALLPFADILKVSGEEMELLTGTSDLKSGSAALAECGPALVFVTLGEQGAFCRRGDLCLRAPAYRTNVVDTTGCGDAFLGAVLSCLSAKRREDLEQLSPQSLMTLTSFACAAGSLVAGRKGALAVMPTLQEILACMERAEHLI